MKLNRKWLLVVALLLSMTMAISGTLAYLTDRDTAENTFTMGKVDITLEEEFEQNSPIKPGIPVEKLAKIINEGEKDAWVWMTVSVPEGLKDYVAFTWNTDTAEYKLISNTPVVVDGQAVWTVQVQSPLAAKAATEDILKAVTLYPNVDFQNGKYVVVKNDGTTVAVDDLEGLVGNKLNVTVNAYAVQTDGLNSVEAAYKAYNKQWGLTDEWDGTADTSWYNDTDTEFGIKNARELAGFAKLVNEGNTFEGKTVKLIRDINLYAEDTTPAADGDPLSFRPIGDHNSDGVFSGTFDGQSHTVKNLYQNGWDLGYDWDNYGSYGLFGNVSNATIKNLILSGGESYIEGGDVSFVAGSATGTCVFENITIKDSIAATYNNGCGGIIGWSGAGNYTFKNINISEDSVLAGLWGSFDSSIGGVVGQGEPGATYNFEYVDIACRIDAYNDCTASYDYYNYRMCGMIIGRLEETTTIDGKNYPDTSKYNITCNDVTVTYGDWANYHYCRATGARAARVEAGYSYGGIAADYDHSLCTAHHMELIAFDQIFGGDQYAVKGLKTYDGVTVVYNNK